MTLAGPMPQPFPSPDAPSTGACLVSPDGRTLPLAGASLETGTTARLALKLPAAVTAAAVRRLILERNGTRITIEIEIG